MQDFWLVVLLIIEMPRKRGFGSNHPQTIFSDWPTVANYVATEWSGVAPAAGESQLHA
jgi:hypothetical protein